MSREIRKIYVDTNVIINYCTGIIDDVEALNYIFKTKRKELLFTSSLAIVQTIANLQTRKKTRKAFSKSETIEKLNRVLNKFTILNLTIDDIYEGFKSDSEDIEDGTHYALSQKKKCNTILTNNVSDFSNFTSVVKISPRLGLGQIKSLVN